LKNKREENNMDDFLFDKKTRDIVDRTSEENISKRNEKERKENDGQKYRDTYSENVVREFRQSYGDTNFEAGVKEYRPGDGKTNPENIEKERQPKEWRGDEGKER
jgi:hypothetical protein